MALKTYDPGAVTVIVAGSIISGFDDTQMVLVARNEDAVTQAVGADGEQTRSINRNRSGRIEISLKQTSESNAVLTALAIADEQSQNSVFPIGVYEKGTGASIHTAAEAYIRKIPDVSYGKESGSLTWVIDCAALIHSPLGN